MQLQAPPAYTAADSPQKSIWQNKNSVRNSICCQPRVNAPFILLEGAEQIPWGDLLLHRLLKSCLAHWYSKRVFLYFPYDLFSSLLAKTPNLQGTIKGCSITLLKRREAVCLTLVCVHTHAVFTFFYSVTLKTDKKGLQKQRLEEVRVMGATSWLQDLLHIC